MPTFTTGDNNLNTALTGLAAALVPDAASQMAAQYRRAAATKAMADAAKTEAETEILREREQRAAALAGPAGEYLVSQHMGMTPGVSDVIAGPPTQGTRAQENFLRELPGAVLSREGNAAQFTDGVSNMAGLAGLLAGDGSEDSLRRHALMMSPGNKYKGGEAITTGLQQRLLDDEQAADRGTKLAVEGSKLHNIPKDNVAVRQGTGGVVAAGSGLNPDGTPTQGVDGYAYKGTGIEPQDYNLINTVNDMYDSSEPVDPELERRYGMAMMRAYGPKYVETKQYNPETGAQELVGRWTSAPIPPGLRVSPELAAALQAPQGNGAAPADTATSSGVAVGGAGASDRLAGSVGMIEPPKPDKRTEVQSKLHIYGSRIQSGLANMLKQLGYDMATGELDPSGFRPDTYTALAEGLPRALRGGLTSEQDQKWFQQTATVLNPLIRADSGAAVPDSEYPRYYDQFIPLPGEAESVVKAKLDTMVVTALAYEEVSAVKGPPPGANDPDSVKQEWRNEMDQAKARIAQEMNRSLVPVNYGSGATTGAPGGVVDTAPVQRTSRGTAYTTTR